MGRALVYWVPDYALTLMAREAPDFYDWKSGVYHFDVPEEMRPALLEQTLFASQDSGGVERLTLDQKRRWEGVLKSLLADIKGDSPEELRQRANHLSSLAENVYQDSLAILREFAACVGEGKFWQISLRCGKRKTTSPER